jgi:hypothetical protein
LPWVGSLCPATTAVGLTAARRSSAAIHSARLFAQQDYRGCAFARASAESHPGDPTEQASQTYRHWVRALLTELATQAGAPEPEILARQLHLLYDGGGQSARMDHDPAAAATARAAAAALLDAELARGTATRLNA